MGDVRKSGARKDTYSRQTYIDGNTVRQIQAVPKRKPRPEAKPQKSTSKETHKNRAKALQTSRGYVMFLAVVSVITLFMCINYLQLRSLVTNQLETVASLESQLNTLKSENDALYDKAMSSIDMEHIKDVAINEMGMNYATEGQIKWYTTSGSSYFRQYKDVPDANR